MKKRKKSITIYLSDQEYSKLMLLYFYLAPEPEETIPSSGIVKYQDFYRYVLACGQKYINEE